MNAETNIQFIDFREDLTSSFTKLNIDWLEKYFEVEPIDNKMLSNPKAYFIDRGGYIYFATIDDMVAGTFALLMIESGIYELSKMAVDPAFQGKSIGNKMLEYCLEVSKKMGAKKLILYSNTKLQPAIHLYSKYGFKEVPLDKTEYKRANIKMEYSFH